MKSISSMQGFRYRRIAKASLFAAVIAAFSNFAFGQPSYGITTLTATNATIIEHEPSTGDDRGGIALSSTKLFYTGDASTGRFDLADMANGAYISPQSTNDAMVSNIKTREVYTLGDAFGAVGYGGGLVTRLVALDETTGAPTGTSIILSTPIVITGSEGPAEAGIFSGWDRIVLMDGDTLQGYNIDLPSGTVTGLGVVNLPADSTDDSRFNCENWATWGVAEFTGGTLKLAYVASSPVGSAIKRFDTSNGNITTIADFPAGLSDMCSFTVDPIQNRWYFHYESYAGAFDFGSDENIGFADASFLAPSASEVSVGGRVKNVKGMALQGVRVTITDSFGVTQTMTTGTFGNYLFKNIFAGGTYVVSVYSRRHYFPVSSEIINVTEDILDLDFEAE